MPLLHCDYPVIGPYTLKGGKVTLRTASGLLGYDARLAMAAGRTFTVSIPHPEGLKEINGKVLSVDLVKGEKPALWQIKMAEHTAKPQRRV